MTHKEIWTTIAEAFYKHERTEATGYGLCRAYDRMVGVSDGEWFCRWAVEDPEITIPYYVLFPTSGSPDWLPEYDTLRGDLATLFAEMTEQEFKKLLDKP